MDLETPHHLSSLTARESRLARLHAAGWSDEEIGARLAIEPTVVGAQVEGLVLKLGLRSRTELALLVRRGATPRVRDGRGI